MLGKQHTQLGKASLETTNAIHFEPHAVFCYRTRFRLSIIVDLSGWWRLAPSEPYVVFISGSDGHRLVDDDLCATVTVLRAVEKKRSLVDEKKGEIGLSHKGMGIHGHVQSIHGRSSKM